MRLLACIRYLARQGLPLRGHNEDVQSCFYKLRSAQICMHTWLCKKPEIVNELITIMCQMLLRQLLSEIRGSFWFSIVADEATDISHHEQMSLSVRWVDDNYMIHEDTLCLVQLPNTKSSTIFHAIKDILIRCSLPLSQCCGQAFDGTANMSGIRNGIQALVKAEAPNALYVHCLAHNLNVCFKEVTKQCALVRNVMNFIYDLVQLIRFSPKRLTLFESLKKDININTGEKTPSLRMLCPSRWTIRHMAIYKILQNYNVLQVALEKIQQGYDEYVAKTSVLLAQMEQFD